MVVYFYPSAFTGGCNAQAHAFATNMDKFKAAGASVVGVSLDSIARLNDFSADPNYCAGQLPVASDADGKIAKSYDLKIREAQGGAKDTRGVEIGHGMAERTTFIVTPDGKVVVDHRRRDADGQRRCGAGGRAGAEGEEVTGVGRCRRGPRKPRGMR